MNRNHKRHCIIIMTILLFNLLPTSVVIATLQITSLADHPRNPLNPISEETNLQDQITQTAPGAILLLPTGTYTERLIINKSLHLKGHGTTQTILHATSPTNGYAIHITAPFVTISDMTIINTGPGLYSTGIKISAPHTTIQNCSFLNTPIGIALWTSFNTITGCTFTACDDEGIALLGTATTPCSNNTIASCTFTQNCDGIELQYAPHNRITTCTFTHNTHAGIDAITAHNNHTIITHCTFTDNAAFGIYLSKSSQTLITHCQFVNDTITLVHATNNTIYKSQGAQIHLMKHSSLFIKECNEITQIEIVSQQSTYQIEPGQTNSSKTEKIIHRFNYLQFLFTILTRFRTLKVLYEQITTVRM